MSQAKTVVSCILRFWRRVDSQRELLVAACSCKSWLLNRKVDANLCKGRQCTNFQFKVTCVFRHTTRVEYY